MTAQSLFIGRTYRLKPEVFTGSVQKNGEPLTSPDVTIVRAKFHMNRKRAWYYDAAGNAYRSEDFGQAVPTIQIEA